MDKRTFLKGSAMVGAGVLTAPAIHAQQAIKWRFQTYTGAALGEHVTKPIIDNINRVAKGELEIELYYADQLVPTGELFRALQVGTIDVVHSDSSSGQRANAAAPWFTVQSGALRHLI